MMRNMLLAMDPPVHTVHRAPLSLHFRARVIGAIEDRVREICRAIMAEAAGATRGRVRPRGRVARCRPG